MLAVLDLGIDLNAWPWIWLITAVVFAIVELTIVGGTFIILPWSVSAFITAILAFYDVPIEIQWAVFVFGGTALFAVMYRWAQGIMRKNTIGPGVGADRLVGLVGIVTTPVEPTDTARRGRIMVEGEVWGVVEPPRAFAPGEHVRVTAMRGTRVVVEPVDGQPDAEPGATPGGAPGATPGAEPGGAPGATPGATPGGAPDADHHEPPPTTDSESKE